MTPAPIDTKQTMIRFVGPNKGREALEIRLK
jgi:hypothetical protein